MGGTYRQDFDAMVRSVSHRRARPTRSRERIAEYVDAGVRHFIFSPCAARPDPRPGRPLLRDDLVPAGVAAATS